MDGVKCSRPVVFVLDAALVFEEYFNRFLLTRIYIHTFISAVLFSYMHVSVNMYVCM